MPKDTIEMIIKVKDEASKGLKGIRGQTAGLTDDLLDVSTSAKSTAGGFDLMSLASSPAAAGVAAIGAAAVTAATGIFQLAKGASDYVDRINFAANETTLSTDTIIALESAAGAAGLEFGQTQEALKGLSARMKEANINGGSAADKFTDLGVALKDAAGESRSADDVFRDSIDAIRLIPNEADRAAASMNIFGESGSRLLPVIEGGTHALDEWGAAAAEAGKAIDENAQQASADFDVAMQNFTNATEGAALSLGTDLLPAVTKLITVGAGMVSWLSDTARWLAEVNPGFQLLSKLVGEATKDSGGGVSFSAEDARMQEIARKRLQFEGGETVGEREAAQREAAKTPAKKARAKKAARAGKAEDPMAGVNAFNALVDELFGAQVIADAQKLADAEALAATNLAAFNKMVDDGIDAQSEARVAAELLAKAETEAADAAMDKARADQRSAQAAAFSAAGGGLESTLGGGALGILAALGPQGAIASNLISLGLALPDILDDLIDELPAIIEKLLVELPAALAASLPELIQVMREMPLMMIEAMPGLIQSLIVDLPIALLKGLPDALSTILVDIPSAFIAAAPEIFKSLIVELPRAFAEALAEILDRLLGGKIKEARTTVSQGLEGIDPRLLGLFGGFLKGGNQQSFAHGGTVGKTGMALVHRGEEIVPENGVSTSSQARSIGMGGSSTHVQLTVNVTGLMDASGADRLVEQLNRAIGPRGFGVASLA